MSRLFVGIPGIQGSAAQMRPAFDFPLHGGLMLQEMKLDEYPYNPYGHFVTMMIQDIQRTVTVRGYDEVIFVGLSVGAIPAIELAQHIKKQLGIPMRLILISAPYPGSAP